MIGGGKVFSVFYLITDLCVEHLDETQTFTQNWLFTDQALMSPVLLLKYWYGLHREMSMLM